MKEIIKRSISFLIVGSLAVGLFAGCGQQKKTASVNGNSASDSGKITNEPVTLTMWAVMPNQVYSTVKSLGETEVYQELEKRTGVHIEFIHPPEGNENENLNILLASGELPDIIENNWAAFSGGPERALQDGYIIPLNEVMKKDAPNISKILKENSEWDRMVKTDDGRYYAFPFLRSSEELVVFFGLVLRKDWLEDLHLDIPTTIDDWYTTLKAFKEKKGATTPLTFEKQYELNGKYGTFSGAYGVKKGFYVEDGRVVYGAIQPGFKSHLETLKKWYSEGLLDPDFGLNDRKAVDSKVLSGQAGAFQEYAGSGMGRFLDAMAQKDPKFSLVAAPYPVLKKGDTPKFGQRDDYYSGSYSAAITTNCKNVDVAAKWLDYGYGEAGHALFNFGIEGESYTMQNGKPTYTDNIFKNPEGLTLAQSLGRYTRANYGGQFVQDVEYIRQYMTRPEQKDAISVWAQTEAKKYNLPKVTPNAEESSELASIMNEVDTYTSEMLLKYVMGTESLDTFDSYVEKVKKMNIQKAIDIEQQALERYNKR